jgi:hypothetical protein
MKKFTISYQATIFSEEYIVEAETEEEASDKAWELFNKANLNNMNTTSWTEDIEEIK